MAGRFHHQMSLDPVLIELNPLIDHIPISDPVQAVMASSIRNEPRERNARAGVGHDRRPRVLPQDDRGHEGDELVPVNRVALSIDHAAAVHVGVKHDPEVSRVV